MSTMTNYDAPNESFLKGDEGTDDKDFYGFGSGGNCQGCWKVQNK